ncbi:MAG TPA: DUF1837 domain-containing protein [Polyangiales bacterium]
MSSKPDTEATSLAETFGGLAREPSDDLAALLAVCVEDLVLSDTKTTSRVHLIGRDANDTIRVSALTQLLARQVVDFCIPRSRRNEAQEHLRRTGSIEEFARLHEEARELFTSLEHSGEAGELLLYMLLERMLGLPQILCKMSLKTSRKMHVHGTDGVHARFEDDGRLALYWGESKLYQSFGSAVDDCLSSLSPYLAQDPTVRDQDLLLLREYVNVDDEASIDALRRYFLATTPEAARVEFRGACLVGFDRRAYPKPNDPKLKAIVAGWRDRIVRGIGEHRLERFEIEFFLIPFPSVDAFRAGVHKALGRR